MLAAVTTIAAAAAKEESGNFLVSPGVGLMIQTLIVFGITFLILRKLAFPRIQEALDKRQHMIEESIEHAEATRREADKLLADYRERLKEARVQADEILSRARQAAEAAERDATDRAKKEHAERLAQAEKDIEAATARAIQDLRKEVANLTVLATEKVTRKVLTPEDQKRLVEEALSELDFTALAGGSTN
jgi:F-type H+-transporting ATPase subunit b